jgi:hypothetical protein
MFVDFSLRAVLIEYAVKNVALIARSPEMVGYAFTVGCARVGGIEDDDALIEHAHHRPGFGAVLLFVVVWPYSGDMRINGVAQVSDLKRIPSSYKGGRAIRVYLMATIMLGLGSFSIAGSMMRFVNYSLLLVCVCDFFFPPVLTHTSTNTSFNVARRLDRGSAIFFPLTLRELLEGPARSQRWLRLLRAKGVVVVWFWRERTQRPGMKGMRQN